jgi:hypothetical protein
MIYKQKYHFFNIDERRWWLLAGASLRMTTIEIIDYHGILVVFIE